MKTVIISISKKGSVNSLFLRPFYCSDGHPCNLPIKAIPLNFAAKTQARLLANNEILHNKKNH